MLRSSMSRSDTSSPTAIVAISSAITSRASTALVGAALTDKAASSASSGSKA